MTHKLLLLAAGLTAVAAVATGAAARTANSEHITLWDAQIGNATAPSHLAATGPLAGSGTARFADSGGKTDHVTIALHGGTITLSAVETRSTFKPDFHACTLSATGHGTFTITGGTGAYSSATGTGTYIRYSTIIGRHAATGACLGKNGPPQASFDTIVMTGNANRG